MTVPVRAQLVDRAAHDVDRDREADAAALAGRRLDLRVDAERRGRCASSSGPPELPWLIARVGLDRAGDLEAGQRLDRAVQRRDDADLQRLLLAERAADRGDRRADARRRASSPSGSGRSVRPAGSTFSSATSALGSKPTTSRRHLVAVGEPHVDVRAPCGCRPLAAGDDVRVGDDLAVARDDEARAQAGLLAPRWTPAVRWSHDRHHARRLLAVDGAGVEAAALGPRLAQDLDARGRRRRRRSWSCGRRTRRRARRPPRGRRPRGPASCGQLQRERRAARHALGAEVALHALGQLVGDRQAEARALGVVAGEERLEDAVQGAALDAGAVVGDRQSRRPLRREAATTTSVPAGVWLSALSMRMRMIWATRSGSHTACTPARQPQLEVRLVGGQRRA